MLPQVSTTSSSSKSTAPAAVELLPTDGGRPESVKTTSKSHDLLAGTARLVKRAVGTVERYRMFVDDGDELISKGGGSEEVTSPLSPDAPTDLGLYVGRSGGQPEPMTEGRDQPCTDFEYQELDNVKYGAAGGKRVTVKPPSGKDTRQVKDDLFSVEVNARARGIVFGGSKTAAVGTSGVGGGAGAEMSGQYQPITGLDGDRSLLEYNEWDAIEPVRSHSNPFTGGGGGMSSGGDDRSSGTVSPLYQPTNDVFDAAPFKKKQDVKKIVPASKSAVVRSPQQKNESGGSGGAGGVSSIFSSRPFKLLESKSQRAAATYESLPGSVAAGGGSTDKNETTFQSKENRNKSANIQLIPSQLSDSASSLDSDRLVDKPSTGSVFSRSAVQVDSSGGGGGGSRNENSARRVEQTFNDRQLGSKTSVSLVGAKPTMVAGGSLDKDHPQQPMVDSTKSAFANFSLAASTQHPSNDRTRSILSGQRSAKSTKLESPTSSVEWLELGQSRAGGTSETTQKAAVIPLQTGWMDIVGVGPEIKVRTQARRSNKNQDGGGGGAGWTDKTGFADSSDDDGGDNLTSLQPTTKSRVKKQTKPQSAEFANLGFSDDPDALVGSGSSEVVGGSMEMIARSGSEASVTGHDPDEFGESPPRGRDSESGCLMEGNHTLPRAGSSKKHRGDEGGGGGGGGGTAVLVSAPTTTDKGQVISVKKKITYV